MADLPIRAVGARAMPESSADAMARYLRPGVLSLPALPPLSIYVHLPWCLKKCPYCDFNSHEMPAPGTVHEGTARPEGSNGVRIETARPEVSKGMRMARRASEPSVRTDSIRPELDESRYLAALRADLESALPLIWGRRVHTVFIGGGTPSLFSPAAIETLIADIRARVPLEPGCEITLEANPGTFERDRFRAYRAAGVTRLSVGVQSFDDRALQAIGRVHDGAQARAALAEARDTFDTFNLDLMYALPGQSLADLDEDLRVALSFEPPHLSIYHLTVEANTVFAKHPPALPDDDSAADMLDLITARTAEAGLARYEVSAFARPGHRCVHNVNYWAFGDYLGIGAGAHSKLSFPHRVIRQMRFREPGSYMANAAAGTPVATDDEVKRSELPFEFMLNHLRLVEGFELMRFTERTGLPLTAIASGLAEAESRGLLARDLARAWPTARGMDFLSDLQAIFLPSAS